MLIGFWQINFGNKIRLRLSNLFFTKYLKQNVNFFVSRDKSILARFTHGETNHIKEIIFYLGNIYSELLIIIFLVTCMFLLNTKEVIILVIFSGFLAFLFDKITKKKLSEAGNERFKYSNQYTKILMDSFRSIRDLKLYKKEEYSINNYKETNKFFGEALVKYGYISCIPRFFFESLAIIFFLLITIITLQNEQNLSGVFDQIALLFLITIRLLPSINKVTTSLTGLRYISPGTGKMFSEYLSTKMNIDNYDEVNKGKIVKFDKEIKIQNLTFSYNSINNIFEDTNITIKKGEKIALIGASGTGKSTFMDLLVGFLESNKGSIEVDEKKHNFNEISRLDLFGYVHQNVILFNDTIFNNLVLNDQSMNTPENLEKIYECCKKAQIYDFVMSLKNGIFTKVGEEGLKISGGQKQRLGIVRALLTDPDILILDEATNSLDSETENNFFQILNNFKKDLTILSINHKIVNKSFFDKTYILSDKKIIKS